MKPAWLTLFLLRYLTQTFAIRNENSFVLTTESNSGIEGDSQEYFENELLPKIYEMRIESSVSNRFARTSITSKVRNRSNVTRETTFSIILPEKAFISEFAMVIGGNSYKGYVKEKEKASNIYKKAVAKGLGAAHVAITARESNRFTIFVNVQALSKATFLLKYEELLKLKDDKYELVINIHPNQPVDDLSVNVMINESIPLKLVQTPPLRSGNEISKREGDLDPRASVFRLDSKSALVQFKPNREKQKEFAGYLGTDESKGLSGQFVVQYDVERDSNGGEVLVKDGYFVHFFAPSEYKPLNKFIVFVLDTSSSMCDQKIIQLKRGMFTILEQLNPNDYFHLASFDTKTNVWNIINPQNDDEPPNRFNQDFTESKNMVFPNAFSGHPDNIKKAKKVILGLRCGGESNIYEALQTALNLIEAEKLRGSHEYLPQPIIMFLTGGGPTVGINNTDRIVTDITDRNNGQTPIYSLSFGSSADENFLRKLSLMNLGFTRHIYEASDAALQLENFYKEIASPLLSGVKFEYVPDAISLTKTKFPLHFAGSEIVVAGKLCTSTFPELPRIVCKGKIGPITFHPTINRPIASLERLWAYLTIQQLLDEKETPDEKKALDLALKYSFVTPVSSLIIVKPNSTRSSTVRIQNTNGTSSLGSRRTRLLSAFRYSLTHLSGGTGFNSSFHRPPKITERSGHSGSKRRFTYMAGRRFRLYYLSGIPMHVPHAYYVDYDETDHDPDENKLIDLKSALPWLENCLNPNGTLRSPPGGYELGLNQTFTLKPFCPETPTNTTGHCKLLHACPQVHPLLTTEDLFVRYFCSRTNYPRRFAGVCCPYGNNFFL